MAQYQQCWYMLVNFTNDLKIPDSFQGNGIVAWPCCDCRENYQWKIGIFYSLVLFWAPLVARSTTHTCKTYACLGTTILCPKVGHFCLYFQHVTDISAFCSALVLQPKHWIQTYPTEDYNKYYGMEGVEVNDGQMDDRKNDWPWWMVVA